MVRDKAFYRTQWLIRRYASEQDFAAGRATPVVDAAGVELPAESVIDGNLLLNEGIAELWDLVIGAGTPTSFANANAYIGVGDSSTAAAAAQTGLQASTNKAYVGMESSYPSRSAQTVTWRAVFGTSTGNFAWQEFTVANGNSDAADNLNRVVSNQGTKASGQTWTVDVAITLS